MEEMSENQDPPVREADIDSPEQAAPGADPSGGAETRTVIKVKGREYVLPFVLPRSGGDVRIFAVPPVNPERFRLRWRTGRNAAGDVTYESKIYTDFEQARKDGQDKVDLIESEERPRDPVTWERIQSDAAAYKHGAEIVKGSGFTVITACELTASLSKEMGPENVRTFAHVYGPRLAKTIPLLVELLVPDFRTFLFEGEKPKNQNERKKEACLQTFEMTFKGRLIGTLTSKEIRTFIEKHQPGDDGFNKWMYCLRALFNFARDEKKALPQLLPTECDLVVYHVIEKPDKDVFKVEHYARLLAAAPDKETTLALKLVFRHHLREEEACGLVGEDFLRDEKGMPYQINVPEDVAKTGQYREIPIPTEHRPVLKALIPDSGPLFKRKDPWARVRTLAKKLKIKWVRNGLRHSCVSYVFYSGKPIEKVAEWDGHSVINLKRHYLVKVANSQAKLFCSIRGSLARIEKLPQVCTDREKSASGKKRGRKPKQAAKAA